MIRVFVFLVVGVFSSWAAQTEYVFLVTADGIRHQEVFTGVDPALMTEEAKKESGVERVNALRKRYWAETPKERREKLMPFLWKMAPEGVIYGNRALGSQVVVSNVHHFSYPGYAEILNGKPLPEIKSNDSIFSPRETVLEFLRRKYNLKATEVAAFGSWEVFNWITMKKEGAIFCNAGYEGIEGSSGIEINTRMQELLAMQFEMLTPWDTVRHDAVTLGLALEYLMHQEPKVMYLALGETDDWAHDRRYDRTVEYVKYFDEALRRLWMALQSNQKYRGKSAIIITTDHGRGRTPKDWTSHGKDVPGADEAWLAVFGPDVKKVGEMKGGPKYSLSNVAGTILAMLGIEGKEYDAAIAPAVKEVTGGK
ncbi:MAG: alkaline phosphatase family protein [Limisphaerales bacterium]